ncbi:MAG: processing protein [Actinomycetota bacterium]|jgi:DNA processing protein|nr:processing protein [Actinomycetota bacterium]
MKRRVIRPSDDEWPDQLNELGPHDPPKQLHAVGRPLPDVRYSVAVVGTRRATAGGIATAERFTRELAEAGLAIVSGLAMGIDAVAHRTALQAKAHTVGVLGCGLNLPYPRVNEKIRRQMETEGTVITEYEPNVEPFKAHFPERNRIIAGISAGVLVIEGGLKSGALITARKALEANRMVWAIPGSVRSPFSEGPNELIRRGEASLVTSVQDLFEELSPPIVWSDSQASMGLIDRVRMQLDRDELAALLEFDDQPITTDRICSRLSFEPGRAFMTLSKLETRGLIRRHPLGHEITDSGLRQRSLINTF